MVGNFDLTSYNKAKDRMVLKNRENWRFSRKICNYSTEEVRKIIESGSRNEKILLSRHFFNLGGLYQRIIFHYSTLLKYSGILIPHALLGLTLSKNYVQKRYMQALDFLGKINIPERFAEITQKILVDGVYYGIIQSLSKDTLTVIDLPCKYCRSRYRDLKGNDIIEFDVSYFDTFLDEDDKSVALAAYPKEVRKHYKKVQLGKTSSYWVMIPSGTGICFSFFNYNAPLFLDVIPAVMQYEDAVDTERERELEEIRKIIVQKIPHLQDGQLLFEPVEAAEMHEGAVNMMRGTPNVSVLTTYADVDSIISRTAADNVNNSLQKMLQHVYSEAGTSPEIFAPTGSQAISTSLTNDLALVMILANKYSRFLTSIIDELFGNINVHFTYAFLPISYYNQSDYITDTLKLAQSGYSYLLPSIAAGVNQRDLISLKNLENDILELRDCLIPLSTSYTQSGNEGGAPEKDLEDKSEKTIAKEESIDNQGGSNG